MTTAIIGLFERAKSASTVFTELEKQSVTSKHINIITSENVDKNSFEITQNTKLPESAGVGAASGGALGLVMGGLTATGIVATGGVGLLASGPLVASLTAGAFGAYGGGILGAVLGTVLPDSEHQAILDEIAKGSVLLCVECDTQNQEKIIKLLKSNQAKQVKVADFSELEKLKKDWTK